MLGAVHQRAHLSVLPGGRKDVVDRRTVRAARRYDRLTRKLFNERGEVVFVPVIGPSDGGSAA